MSTRIVLVDYVIPVHTDQGDICTGCPRLDRVSGECGHFGSLARKQGTKSTYLRHANCIRAEERTRHASNSQLMLMSDFLYEDSAVHDKDKP